MPIASFKELEVWQRAVSLVAEVYKLTGRYPRNEVHGLTGQMRRAAVSIPSNIAEGSRQRTSAALVHYLGLALGSAGELETQLEISRRLGYAANDDISSTEELVVRVAQMLNKLRGNLERSRVG